MTSVQRTPWPFPTPAARPAPAGVRERLLRQPRGSRLTEIERMKSIVEYNPDTGIFSRLVAAGGRKVGDVCGWTMNRGYINVNVGGCQVLAHRLAWMFMYGPIPPKMDIDHIDGDRKNNRIANLRLATRSQNNQNISRARSDNRTGLLGAHVGRSLGSYTSRISVNGKDTFLGTFATAEDAHAAYMKAKQQLHAYAPHSGDVKVRQVMFSSPYEYEFCGSNLSSVHAAAESFAQAIDPIRSPAVKAQFQRGEDWIVVVRYYPVD
ncbi:HNH endonuclease signature motif containing protein [Cupriavidus campinensis]|uniref:HNH endonuclease n=1 Tax=Cupriavidus campinensis TaxID=151783 RepID=A0AAE9HY85_9BURK|nr:HNH endonuclease signature motif containing protein [Cupriavidus campinensis]URF03001.1 HNH endonuclease [Cupriavidus campinensis]